MNIYILVTLSCLLWYFLRGESNGLFEVDKKKLCFLAETENQSFGVINIKITENQRDTFKIKGVIKVNEKKRKIINEFKFSDQKDFSYIFKLDQNKSVSICIWSSVRTALNFNFSVSDSSQTKSLNASELYDLENNLYSKNQRVKVLTRKLEKYTKRQIQSIQVI